MTDRQPPEMRVSGAQSRPEAGSGWRPIEEYPTDKEGWGPNALLFVPTGLQAPASDYRILTGRMEAEEWLDWGADGSMGDLGGTPTHWMPLPEPPTEAGTPALNTPPRSAEAALAVARGTLIGIRAGLPKEWKRSLALIDKALADIDTLCPPVKR